MPILQHKAFSSAYRKAMMRDFGLFQAEADLSWIASFNSPPQRVNLTPLITGDAGQSFNVGYNVDSVWLLWNGQKLVEGVGYNFAGGVVTMAAGYAPQPGHTLEAFVWGDSSDVIHSESGGPQQVVLTSQITSGEGQTFNLGIAPPSIGLVWLHWNGSVLENGVGFTLSGNTITMAAGYAPESGDNLIAYVWSA